MPQTLSTDGSAAELPLWAVQHLSKLCRQAGEGERLRDHLNARIEPSVMDDGVSRVSAGEQHLQTRSPAARLVGQLPAVHPARQPDIGEQQRDLAPAVEQPQGSRRIRRVEHLVIQLPRQIDGEAANRRLVLDDEDGLLVAARNGGAAGRVSSAVSAESRRGR